MRRKIHRCHEFVNNVDFNKLNKILKEKGLTKAEVSRKCGYYDEYITKHAFKEKKLNTVVASVLKNVYGISPEEYADEEPQDNEEEEPQDNEKDMYTLRFSCNGEFLKRLACASMNRHMSIEDFIFNCIIEGIGDKILDNEGRKD